MTPLRSPEVAAFSATVQKIHSAVDFGNFYRNAFLALEPVFPDALIVAQEFHVPTGEACSAANRPTPSGVFERCGELVPREHAIYHALQKGAQGALRLSDFQSQRQLRRTALYHEIFRPLGVRYEIVLPLRLSEHIAGFTISRERDFSDEELCMSQMLVTHLELAHRRVQRIAQLERLAARGLPDTGTLLALGLSPREAEVMHWIMEGKRDSEIAKIVEASVRTVQAHVRGILAKFGVETRTAAVAEALRSSICAVSNR